MRVAAFVFAFALLLIPVAAAEPTVTARDGNIFINRDGAEKQLTSTGRDSNPVLDPQGRWVVFVRTVPGQKKVLSGSGEHDAAELWQIRSDGKEPTMLVRTRQADKMENIIAGFEDVQFSSNGRLVYFVTPAWATSGAVRVVDTTNKKERFVVAGGALRVIQSGKYRDHLLLSQHRYFLGGGSYDWFYVFSPEGKEVGVVGEDTSNFEETQID